MAVLLPAQQDVPLVNVQTGEVVDTQLLGQIADAILSAREVKRHMDELIAALSEAAVEHARQQGTKTLHAGAHDVVVGPDSTIDWDLDVLAELLEAGLPEERFTKLLKTEVSYKVDARVVKQLSAANPRYAEIIDRAARVVEIRPRVTVKAA